MKIFAAIIFSFLCFTLASQELKNQPASKDSTFSIADNELKELEQKLESEDPTFRFKFLSEKDVSFFLMAQKKRPQSFIWIDLIIMHFAGEKFNAQKLENDIERKILFKNALRYLTESLETLENETLTNSNDSIKKLYFYYSGILKEDIAYAALETEELGKAKELAKGMLINGDSLAFNYGNILHNANTLLGRVALRENDLPNAKAYLIKSAKIPGSPTLNTFGPSFILAKELLKNGEKEIVLEYLNLVAGFWNQPSNGQIGNNRFKTVLLNKWKEEIKSGKIPDDPRWR